MHGSKFACKQLRALFSNILVKMGVQAAGLGPVSENLNGAVSILTDDYEITAEMVLFMLDQEMSSSVICPAGFRKFRT